MPKSEYSTATTEVKLKVDILLKILSSYYTGRVIKDKSIEDMKNVRAIGELHSKLHIHLNFIHHLKELFLILAGRI